MIRLLGRGANPNTVDPTAKTTTLHSACAVGCLETVELLLKYNADVNGKDFNGVTPLLEACRNGQDKVVRLLLRRLEGGCVVVVGKTAFSKLLCLFAQTAHIW